MDWPNHSILLAIIIILTLFACKKHDVNNPEPKPELTLCEVYASGTFNGSSPGKVPLKYWPCMNTKDMVEAGSDNFPSIYMLTSGCCGLQSGYDLCRKRYSWFIDLENREDALANLINKYISIDTIHYDMNLDPIHFGGYKWYTYNLEVLLAQEAYLKSANDQQRITLLNELFVKQNVRKGKYGYGGTESPAFAMSRVMYYAGYKPLLDSIEQNIQIKMLVELGNLNITVEGGKRTRETIFSMANTFSNQLKTKNAIVATQSK